MSALSAAGSRMEPKTDLTFHRLAIQPSSYNISTLREAVRPDITHCIAHSAKDKDASSPTKMVVKNAVAQEWAGDDASDSKGVRDGIRGLV